MSITVDVRVNRDRVVIVIDFSIDECYLVRQNSIDNYQYHSSRGKESRGCVVAADD